MVAVRLAVDGECLVIVVLVVGANADVDFVRLARSEVEFPQAEVLLVNDRLAVARQTGPEERAAGLD